MNPFTSINMTSFVSLWILRSWIVVVVIALSGCSLMRRKSERPLGDPNAGTPPVPLRSEFSPIDASYASGQLQEALKGLEPILKKGHQNPDYALAIFRAARVHEALGQWPEAIKLYRNLLALSLRGDANTRAEILRRIALCHEGAGDHKRALLAWIDLSKNPALAEPVRTLEVPLRIASLYHKLGHHREADIFFKSVEKALKKDPHPRPVSPETTSSAIVADLGKRKSEVLISMARTLGLTPTLDDLESAQPSIFRSQDYLVQTILTPASPSINEASQELERSFEAAMALLAEIPVPKNEDSVVAYSMQLERKKALAAKLHQRLMIVLNPLDPKLKIYESLWAFDQKLGMLLYERSPIEKLTPESQEREGLFRKGVVIDPAGRLEKLEKQQKKSRQK